jgi:hypothetical protein
MNTWLLNVHVATQIIIILLENKVKSEEGPFQVLSSPFEIQHTNSPMLGYFI